MMKFKKVRQRRITFSEFSKHFLRLADLISTMEFNEDGEFLAVGDKGGRIVIFQREPEVNDEREEKSLTASIKCNFRRNLHLFDRNTMFTLLFILMNRNSII